MGSPTTPPIGANVQRTRQRQNISREKIAAALGVSQETLAAWESGAERIAPQMVYRIALVLGVPVSALFSIEEFIALSNPPPDADQPSPEQVAFDRLLRESRAAVRNLGRSRRHLIAAAAEMAALSQSLQAALVASHDRKPDGGAAPRPG